MPRRAVATLLIVALVGWPAAAQALVVATVDAELLAGAAAGLAPHPPIRIEGDGAFAAPLSGVRGGDGTARDPYVIEGWLILSSFSDGIDLRHTRAHVLVREVVIVGETPQNAWKSVCRLDDPSCHGTTGIRVRNATNVTIERVEIHRVGDAFGVYDSSDVTIRDSVVGRASDVRGGPVVAGIAAARTSGLVVEDVRIRRTAFPLVIEHVTDVRLDGLDASGGIVSSLFDAQGALLVRSRFHNAGLFIGGAMRDFSVVGTTFEGATTAWGTSIARTTTSTARSSAATASSASPAAIPASTCRRGTT